MSYMRIIYLAISIVLLSVLSSCRIDSSKNAKPTLVASYDAYKWIIKQISGDDFEISVLLPSGSNPETYEPDMRSLARLEDSSLYFGSSTLGFESDIESRIRNNYPGIEIFNIAEGIEPVTSTHISGDPHLLSSLQNAGIIAGNIYYRLVILNPDKREEYSKRYAGLSTRINTLAERYGGELDSVFKESGKRAFLVIHPSMSYFARDYGLQQISLEREGKEPTPRQMQYRLEEGREAGVVALFYENGEGENRANEIASQLGIRAYPVSFTGMDFLENISIAERAIINEAGRKLSSQSKGK